jgi:gliding motility-associated-like protein
MPSSSLHFFQKNKFRKVFTTCIAILCAITVHAQENCANGIDDDGNGLIDLNDPLCVCEGFSNTTGAQSLIPNSSFEDYNSCPNSYSQVSRATGWIQATEPTSDYMNTCGFVFGAATAAGLVPFPDGNGILGTIFSPGWQEYVGSCLTSTMMAGNNYQLTFSIASTPIDGSGGVCNGGVIDFEPIDIVIYGNANCGALPVNTNGCPSGANASWVILGSINYVPVAVWDEVTISFTPAQNVNAVIIGSPCALPPGYSGLCYPYFYFDNLILNETTFFNSLSITPTGDYCSDDVVLTASTDTSGGMWQWFREGVALVGETDAVLNVSAQGYGVGTFQARYTIGGQCEVTDILLEDETLIAEFSFDTVCAGMATTFSDLSTITAGSIDMWAWDFGDGNGTSVQQNPTCVFPSGGTYAVELTSTLGVCTSTVTHQVEVYHNPIADFVATEVCLNDSNFLSDRSSTLSGVVDIWDWHLGDLTQAVTQDVIHTYGASGTYDVELNVTTDLGCEGTVTLPVIVHAPPVVDFSYVEACENYTASFTDESVHADGIDAWDWDFGDAASSALQNPLHVFTAQGTYDAELIAFTPFGCSDTVIHQITVFPSPVAGFINDTVCARLATSFTDTSSVSSGNIVSWAWNFGDGGTSPQQNPTHIFMTGGTYNVRLVVTTDESCVDSLTRTVVVHAKPVAEFVWTDECLNNLNQFIDGSTVAAGTQIVLWDWDMGDNLGTSTSQDTVYEYAQSGTYNVTLMCETDFGCRDTVNHEAEVFDLPISDFSVNDECLYDPVLMVNASNIPSGTIAQHLWNFGDNTTANVQAPVPHTYPQHGVYDVELVTVSNNGCTDTLMQQVEVFAVPLADFTFDTVCFPIATSFTDLSAIIGADQMTEWEWRFGDGNLNTTDQHATHNYDQWGDYTVTLTVTSENGCVDDTTMGPARVHPKPRAIFSDAIANCHQDSTFFFDLSTLENYPLDSLVGWAWDYGDGGWSDLPDPIHLYADEGFFDASLAVMSNHGCVDTVVHPVEIYPLPRVALSADTTRGCQPFRAQFFDESTIPAPYNLSRWEWNFGDGSDLVSTQFPVHTYYTDTLGPFDEGIFTVSLTVTSGNGCVSSDTIIDYMTEYPRPQAWFDVDPKRAELLFARMQVTDLSSPNVTDWNYHFGDGTSASNQHPYHIYTDTGAYTITQFVATQYGCLDTAEFTVVVDPEFYFYIPNTFTPNNEGHNEFFFGTGVGVVGYNMVIFDRWGSQVFESGEMGYQWDGTKNGHPVQQGVYTYMFKIVDVRGNPHEYVGHVNLIR